MSHELQLILNITIAIGTALAGGLAAHWLRQSPIVGYLLAGMMIGPFTPGFVGDREQIAVLAEVGVIFLMFALGIEFSLKDLARVKGPAVVGTSAQLLLIMAAGTALGMALGWPLVRSIFFGGIISVSSTMVILKNLMNRGELASNHGRLLLGMLIVQDLAVVILILFLPKLAGDINAAAVELLWVLLKALLFIGATLFLGARVVPHFMTRVEQLRSPELFLLTAVVLALGTASVSALLGLSPALGAFMGGLMLTETEFDHRVIAEMIPMRDLFATLFFVSVGMLLDIRFIVLNLPAVVGIAFFIMLVKVLATCFALIPFKLGGKTIAFTALGMVSVGEFNYVLAHVGRTSGAIPQELYNLILSASLLTIVFTPAAFWIAPRVSRTMQKVPILGRIFSPQTQVQHGAEGLNNHAIVVGYGRVGQRMARGMRQAGLPVVVIEQDLNLVREISAGGLLTVYGDASYENVLEAAHPSTARVVVVALPDFGATRAVIHRARRANPDVLIVARAQRAENDVKLREAGATAVVVPEIAGSLMLLEETLLLMGLPHDHIFTGLSTLPRPDSIEANSIEGATVTRHIDAAPEPPHETARHTA
ncbi:MAG TPA: cation:proton antiporter [Abditibacteriaceae bacterium]|jgi:CPA2 family monovalent cation:H+ antiporter-2